MRPIADALPPRVYHAPGAPVAPATPAASSGPRPAWMCGAYGCPLAGTLSAGGERRFCGFHYGIDQKGSDHRTRWLRNRPAIVAALRVTGSTPPEEMSRIGRELVAAGLSQFAPRTVTVTHAGYGRRGDGITAERDECLHPRLYVQRLNAMVTTEIGR
jgi:hypothetical protein